jgi:hypothetical protein
MIKFIIHALEFPNLSTGSTKLTVVKMASRVEEFLMPTLEEEGRDDMLYQGEISTKK